jgi:putative hemolysin
MKPEEGKIGGQGESKDFINIDELFRRKGKKIYPFIPGFLIRYLERVVHEKEVNSALNRLHDKHGLEFIEPILLDEFGVEIQVKNQEFIPEKGRYIIASNHPLGGLDGMALMHAVGKKRKDIKFIVNDILLELVNLKELFVPVNKHGRNTQEAVRILDELYRSDMLVLIFPAGLVSRKQAGGVRDLEWKKSFISKSIQYQRDVVPVHIDGRNSSFFYNLANWRKRVGLKMNIEMLYLPDEMFRQRNKKITITFGKPIPYTTFTKELTHQQWAQKVKEHVYGLPEGNLNFNLSEK